MRRSQCHGPRFEVSPFFVGLKSVQESSTGGRFSTFLRETYREITRHLGSKASPNLDSAPWAVLATCVGLPQTNVIQAVFSRLAAVAKDGSFFESHKASTDGSKHREPPIISDGIFRCCAIR